MSLVIEELRPVRRLGIAAGVIPGFGRGSLTPELEPTTIMYKHRLNAYSS